MSITKPMTAESRDDILKGFLKDWPISRLRSMTLEDYTNPGSKDSFCYDIEYRTKHLANISGSPSSKFEIFKRVDPKKYPKSSDYGYDENYTWRNRDKTLKSRDEAWEYTKQIIIETAEFASKGDFRSIDKFRFAPFILWKIAFLYSDYKIVSISDKKALRFIAEMEGMTNFKNARVSDLHKYIMKNVNRDSYWPKMIGYWNLFKAVKDGKKWKDNSLLISEDEQQELTDINDSIHLLGAKEVIIRRRHNNLQNQLLIKLKKEFGVKNVHLEKNQVDIVVKTISGIRLYEVKISNSAKNCIREGLGQLLEYSFYKSFNNIEELIIVGNHALKEEDNKYVQYLKSKFFLNIKYLHERIK